MKTKVKTLIVSILLISPITVIGENSSPTSKMTPVDNTNIDISELIYHEPDVDDFGFDTRAVFNEIVGNEAEMEFDISELIYHEPDVDDFGFDTRAVFNEIVGNEAEMVFDISKIINQKFDVDDFLTDTRDNL